LLQASSMSQSRPWHYYFACKATKGLLLVFIYHAVPTGIDGALDPYTHKVSTTSPMIVPA
jgi:hypothetical protein